MSRSSRIRAAGLTVALAGGMLFAGSAAPASANPFACLYENQSTCAKVTAIDSGSYLALHNKPNYSGGVVKYSGRAHNGAWFDILCWTTGAGDADGHGDTYWFEGDFVGGPVDYPDPDQINTSPGYVNDWYLTTGAASEWKKSKYHIPHC